MAQLHCLLQGGMGGMGGMSVLDIDTAGLYRPRTKETREAYEALLSIIQVGAWEPECSCSALLLGAEALVYGARVLLLCRCCRPLGPC